MSAKRRCVVCKGGCDRTVGHREIVLHEGDCEARFRTYLAPRANHSTLERDAARARFAQSDTLRDDT